MNNEDMMHRGYLASEMNAGIIEAIIKEYIDEHRMYKVTRGYR